MYKAPNATLPITARIDIIQTALVCAPASNSAIVLIGNSSPPTTHTWVAVNPPMVSIGENDSCAKAPVERSIVPNLVSENLVPTKVVPSQSNCRLAGCTVLSVSAKTKVDCAVEVFIV